MAMLIVSPHTFQLTIHLPLPSLCMTCPRTSDPRVTGRVSKEFIIVTWANAEEQKQSTRILSDSGRAFASDDFQLPRVTNAT
eukprot:767820-Hanusia_phi.AAC.2